MYKLEIILFIFSLIFGCLFMLSSCNKEQVTRIRIVSSDDTIDSINEKLLVKEEILNLLSKIDMLDVDELIVYLDNNLSKKFSNYSVEYIYDTYPAKSLNGKMIESGTYPTIRITLGKGMGSNWWSILYPEYFNVSYEDSSEIEYRSYFYDKLVSK